MAGPIYPIYIRTGLTNFLLLLFFPNLRTFLARATTLGIQWDILSSYSVFIHHMYSNDLSHIYSFGSSISVINERNPIEFFEYGKDAGIIKYGGWCIFIHTRSLCIYDLGLYAQRQRNASFLSPSTFSWSCCTLLQGERGGTQEERRIRGASGTSTYTLLGFN